MNDVAKLYQVYVNREIQTTKNEILNTKRINQKILAFLHDLSEVSLESRCYLFWEKEEPINHQQLLEKYLEGLTMLMSIGYELRIDSIKNHTEIPENLDIYSLFFKIHRSILNVQNQYSSDDYQDAIDDYFTLGFQLGIDIDEIIDNYQND
ncbi:dUTP diphosphatase [Massilimicrobiota timonensis]|uniref:dUTP diphosphatase n=1 Tax=Massilimicrobiota timonensis TaxID=1776392 RepID=UPI001960D2B3|nr:dUTP diphosphatase [Massilimicrobiota timonensis]MBM6966525.1 dUTP diphosphatase [Massilimicrobiota timonensis]